MEAYVNIDRKFHDRESYSDGFLDTKMAQLKAMGHDITRVETEEFTDPVTGPSVCVNFYTPNAPNPAQEAVFQLMRASEFNDFRPDAVIEELQNHRELWTGAIWGRFESYMDALPLRDIEQGFYNADTLLILARPGKEDKLFKLARRSSPFSADEVDWLSPEQAEKIAQIREEGKVLRVWWD